MRSLPIAVAVGAGLVAPVIVPVAPEPAAAAEPCSAVMEADGLEPPCNPFLADSIWAANHRNSYAQGSSPAPGPSGPPQLIDVHHEGLPAAPIILTFSPPYSDGSYVVWGSTVGVGGSVFKLDPESFRMIDEYRAAQEGDGGGQDPGFSGAYNILDRDNRLISTLGAAIVVYGDTEPGVRTSPIERLHRLELPPDLLCRPDSDEIVVGTNMTYDGHIAFATSYGVVGVVPREPERMTADAVRAVSLNGDRCDDPSVADEDLEEVANTIATDEAGGIYVITDTAQHRLGWDGSELREDWRVEYRVERDRGGSLGPGSGASPTLLGTRPEDDRFVVIYDDAEVFNLVLLWRDEIPADWEGLPGEDRRVACVHPVDFGRDDGEAWSEQSPLVRGNAVVLVNDRLQGDAVFEQVPSRLAGFNQLTGGVPGNEPRGVERIDWDPASRTCATVWERPDLAIPNTVPTMSSGSGAFYGVGVRDGMWTLEAVDWGTGESRFHVETAPYPTANSFWAASTVGPDRSVYVGTFGGVTRWQQCDPTTAETCGRRPDPVEYLVGDPSDTLGQGPSGESPGDRTPPPDDPDRRGDRPADGRASAEASALPATGDRALAAWGLLGISLALAAGRRRR